MGGAPYGAGPASPFGGPQSPSLAFGPGAQGQQPPRFSAGSLISDGDLPEWLRQEPDGAAASQPAWGAPAQPAQPAQGWPQAPQPPQQHDIAALHTVRQPAVGAPNPPQQPQPMYPRPPAYQPPPAPAAYPQQSPPAYPQGYPQQGQPGYPQGAPQGFQQGYPQTPAPFAPPPAYPPAPAGYPQQPANYGRPPAPPQPPTPINAFPGIESAGTAYNGPQRGGLAAHALLNQQSLPNWLAGAQPGMAQTPPPRGGAPSGMQARSLVDDQALPRWLRDQPDQAERPNVSEWIGASAAQEPMPPFLNDAYAQAQIGRAPQPGPAAFGQAYGQAGAPFSPQGGVTGGSTGFGDDAAMPDWLRAQAGAAPGAAPARPAAPAGGAGFSASDLIDPSALPAWVTGKAPPEQVFSSTQGWSAASTAADSSFGVSDQGYGASLDQGAEQAYEQGYEQGDDGDEGGQPAWGDAQWDAGVAPNEAPPERRGQRGGGQRQPHGRPLAAEELPPWLRNKAGAQAPNAPMASAERNPWASAAAPMDAWDEEEPWDAQGDAGAQGWGEASQWSGAGVSDQGAQSGASMGGWGFEEPADDWSQQRMQSAQPRRRGEWDDEPSYSSGAHPGYADDRYPDDRAADRYGHSPDGYDEYDGYEEYDDEPSDGKRGRGWLGFMRRNKR